MIKIGKRTVSFNLEVVSKLDYEGFEKMCEEMLVFMQLPIKERKTKIKEAHGYIKENVKQVQKPRSGKDSCSSDKQPIGGDSGAKQGSDDRGQNFGGQKDKAKVQKPPAS